MSASVFISYASQDQKVASTLCKALEGRGFPCWIAARDIAPGENFQIAIVRAIRSARIMLLVFTSNSNNSDEMAKELALASQSKLIVVPLLIDDVRPNDAFSYEFATRQWIDFFSDWETAIEQLAQRIAVALETDAASKAPAPELAPAGQPAPTPDVIAAAIAAQPAEAAGAKAPTLVDAGGKTAVLSASELAAAAPSAAASASAGPSSFRPAEAPKRGAPVMLFVAIGVLVVVAVAGAAVIAPSFLKKPAPPPAAVAVTQPQAPALSITPAPPPNPALVTQPTAVSPGPMAAGGHAPGARSGSSSPAYDRTAQADAGAQEDPDLDPETHPARPGRGGGRRPGGGAGGSPDVPF